MSRLIIKLEKKLNVKQQKIINNLRKKKDHQKDILGTKVITIILPSMPNMKQIDLRNKHCSFVSDMYYESMCLEQTKKQQDDIKAHHKDIVTKRKEKLD